MRWAVPAVMGVLIVAGCSQDGTAEPPVSSVDETGTSVTAAPDTAAATLQIDGAVYELDYYDCARSDYAYSWAASSESPRISAWGGSGEGAGTLQVGVDTPDGGSSYYVALDPVVVESEGLEVSGVDGSTEISLRLPCVDLDPGTGTFVVDGEAGTVGQVACFLDATAPNVTARGSLGGREFLLQLRRAPAPGGGFEDVVEFVVFDSGDEYTAEGSFEGDPPFDERTGIFTLDGASATASGIQLDGAGGALQVDVDLACGLVRRP